MADTNAVRTPSFVRQVATLQGAPPGYGVQDCTLSLGTPFSLARKSVGACAGQGQQQHYLGLQSIAV